MKKCRRMKKRKESVRFAVLVCAVIMCALFCIRNPDCGTYNTRTEEVDNAPQDEMTDVSKEVQAEESLANGYFVQPASGVLTSKFGIRGDRQHNGIDIGADTGTDVFAADGGVVVYAAPCGGYGNYIVIDHGNGFRTAYGHLDEILAENGDTVKAKQLVGRVGSTGNSTGPHLHFEVKSGETFIDPLDYVAY